MREALTAQEYHSPLDPKARVKHVRSHHILGKKDEGYAKFRRDFHSAIFGRINESEMSSTLDGLRSFKDTDPQYVTDFFGSNPAETFNTVLDRYITHNTALGKLSDTDILSIGTARDGLCEIAVKGNHCFDCLTLEGDQETVDAEQMLASLLLKTMKILLPTIKEGKDFLWVTEMVPLRKNGIIEMTPAEQLHIRVGLFRTYRNNRDNMTSHINSTNAS